MPKLSRTQREFVKHRLHDKKVNVAWSAEEQQLIDKLERGMLESDSPRPVNHQPMHPKFNIPTKSKIAELSKEPLLPKAIAPQPAKKVLVNDALTNLTSINPKLVQGIADMNISTLTDIQKMSMDALLLGGDCHLQSQTGTGKTLAYLLPACHRMLSSSNLRNLQAQILIISPTRELATQIADEARALLKYAEIKVTVSIGGTNSKFERAELLNDSKVIVATPGRLLDHLGDDNVATLVYNLDCLVLDEVDRLLDMGFTQDIMKLISFLPKERQTIICSATNTERLHSMTKRVLKSDYQFFTVVSSISESTLQNIEQFHVSALLTDHFRMACSIVDQTYNNSNKIIIFIPTANMAEVYYECLSSKHEHVWVQHARQSQAKRQHVYESFRDCEHGLLVCTDLVARGMDFPSVSIVIQVGVPIDRETYIHRVGRTGRAKASGISYLIISKEEEYFLYQLKGIPIKRQERKITVDHFQSNPQNSEAFYVAWLGYYKAQMKKMGFCPDELVHTCNLIVQDLFKCDEPPSIDSKTITKLGLRGCSEIRSIGKK